MPGHRANIGARDRLAGTERPLREQKEAPTSWVPRLGERIVLPVVAEETFDIKYDVDHGTANDRD